MNILFKTGFKNQLLINPKLSLNEKETLLDLQNHFEEKFDSVNFFLITSSGSAQKANESPKFVALHLDSVLQSALRFNQYFKAESFHKWGLVLPLFHVAGLSIQARAFLSQAEVEETLWIPEKIKTWLTEEKISFLSLVPAQVYDLVQLKISSPECLLKVFVGAGQLNQALKQEFLKLGWPLVETYGMTETCSMIAVKESGPFYKILPGVSVQTENQFLQIKCNSLAHSTIQKKNGHYNFNLFDPMGWFKTEDQVEIIKTESGQELQFKGRSYDYIKILGEGVSMPELREKLDQITLTLNALASQTYLLAVADSRSENRLVLAVDKTVLNSTQELLVQEFNSLVRPYEKIQSVIQVEFIPRTELGKVKIEDLKNLVLNELHRRNHGQKI